MVAVDLKTGPEGTSTEAHIKLALVDAPGFTPIRDIGVPACPFYWFLLVGCTFPGSCEREPGGAFLRLPKKNLEMNFQKGQTLPCWVR